MSAAYFLVPRLAIQSKRTGAVTHVLIKGGHMSAYGVNAAGGTGQSQREHTDHSSGKTQCICGMHSG
ncbi:hypothetical protein DPEC_G00320870 [Dallia pectoralis]|uniref:Uncharacterized protein n=1 Tax=Dallia pectoralis TaxID=75939 RepID=A0ACC2FA17_DALPE|nr:hypothetical protein DPEC_G00320870 [Dallia pectoralis]